MPNHWKLLTDYTAEHHGVVGLKAATDLGLTKHHLHEYIRNGRLRVDAPEAYVITGSPDTWRQAVMVATASSCAWASHRTAAALWQLEAFEGRKVEVLSPYGKRRERRAWTVHETRRFRSVDLNEVAGIPCTAVPRTVLDLAAIAHPVQVGRALDDACRRWDGMLQVIAQRFVEIAGRGRKGTRLMRAMLDERLGQGRFTQTTFEESARKLARSVGLPDPVPQYRVADGAFRVYLDLAWPDVLWAVECDSLAWHSGKQAHEWDRQRRRQLKALGWDLVEVTYDDVTKRPDETGEQLVELYRQRRESFDPVTAPQPLASVSAACPGSPAER